MQAACRMLQPWREVGMSLAIVFIVSTSVRLLMRTHCLVGGWGEKEGEEENP